MIKVLFLIPTLGHGGAERVLTNLVNNMDKTEFDITVQTMFDVGIYQDRLNKNIKYKGGFKYYFRGNTWVFKLFSPKFLYKRYVKEKYDVIVSYLEGPSARVVSGCKGKNIKLVSWIHLMFKDLEIATRSFRNFEEAKTAYNKFDKTICVSEDVKNAFCDIFDFKGQIDVLYNTVEADIIKEKSLDGVTDIFFNKDEINLISVAKLMKVKGYDRLVRIQKKLRDKGLPVHVYIVGVGEEQKNLQKLVDENGLTDYWTFVGFRENPYKYVANADLYVCSSHNEGFSTAVTEALIVGTPVVSTRCSGAEELLGYNNEYGIVTDNNEDALYEGIEKMLTQEGLLEFYKEKAATRGEKFSVSETVGAVEKMLREVVLD